MLRKSEAPLKRASPWLPVSTIKELAERTGIDRSEVSGLIDLLREKGWVKILRPDEQGHGLWVLTKVGRKILPPFTPGGYESIGGWEAQGLALSVREAYLSRGWYFALARQDGEMKRKVDCVAYDYEHGLAVGIEIESSAHVLHDHPEQVKQHMLEISPFDEIHFWAPKAAVEKIEELKSSLGSKEAMARVKVFEAAEATV